MLELNNVTKVYAAKGGASVRALDGVSVRFGEKGLVFLLGKSGSGKSTLLNVAGGLDRPTEGEIIVGDKRSSDFTPSDFDSYRNTYVGFVFQEYNLLDEFSVRENISLALELQGKAQAATEPPTAAASIPHAPTVSAASYRHAAEVGALFIGPPLFPAFGVVVADVFDAQLLVFVLQHPVGRVALFCGARRANRVTFGNPRAVRFRMAAPA